MEKSLVYLTGIWKVRQEVCESEASLDFTEILNYKNKSSILIILSLVFWVDLYHPRQIHMLNF